MKKTYLSLAGMIVCGTIISQNAFKMQDYRMPAVITTDVVSPLTNLSNDRTGTAFRYWVEPIGTVMAVKGITEPPAANPNQSLYINPVYMDSTVRLGSGTTTTAFVTSNLVGTVFDPKSTNLQTSHLPIVTHLDAYNIDSVAVLGSYMKKTATNDTLYTWIVWGDTANTAVFTKVPNAVWGPPVDSWRTSLIGPKLTGASTAQGNKVKAAAPTSNYILVKRVLTNSDSVGVSGHVKNIKIKLPTAAAVPAGNIVSCFYTFVPGGTHTLGDCCYAFPGATVAQTVNGFAGIVWGQHNPVVSAMTDYANQQVDPSSWCMGASFGSDVRYNQYPTSYSTFMTGDLLSPPVISYSIYGNTTTGISELAQNGFELNQNTPNPFTNQTVISYSIKNNAASAALEIYDIRGVKIFEKVQKDVKEGRYSVEVNNAGFASGIYFYSLTVDGKKITKKMIVE